MDMSQPTDHSSGPSAPQATESKKGEEGEGGEMMAGAQSSLLGGDNIVVHPHDGNLVQSSTKSGNRILFPRRVRLLLNDAAREGNQDIASWSPNGKTFFIHDPERFKSTIMSRYFRQTRFSSFTRQL